MLENNDVLHPSGTNTAFSPPEIAHVLSLIFEQRQHGPGVDREMGLSG